MSSSSSTLAAGPAHRGGLRGWIDRHPLLAAYFIVFGLAWTVTLIALIGMRGNLPNPLQLVLGLVVGWSPAFAAVFVTALTGGKPAVRELLGRLLRFRVGMLWYLVGLFLMAAVIMGGIGLHVLFGGAMPPIPATASTSVGMVLVTFVGMILMGVVLNTEEVLWRGFALPRLQARYDFVVACLLLAIPEILLHLPNFFDPDARFYRTVGIFWFAGFSIAAVILYAWIFNHTRGSLVIVTLLHASQNAWSNLLSDNSLRPFQFTVGLLWVIALSLVLVEWRKSARQNSSLQSQPVEPNQ